jgi:hypothetical protein
MHPNSEMLFQKRTTRRGFQVSFEFGSADLVGESHVGFQARQLEFGCVWRPTALWLGARERRSSVNQV